MTITRTNFDAFVAYLASNCPSGQLFKASKRLQRMTIVDGEQPA